MDGVLFEGSMEEFMKCASLAGHDVESFLYLIDRAGEAKLRSYAPYSHFNVGVAGTFKNDLGDWDVFTGANQENAAYSPTLCGEVVAIAQARHSGFHTIEILAVCGGLDSSFDSAARAVASTEWVAPCGRCRQVICETASPDCLILLVRGDSRVMIVKFAALFPLSFGPKNLGIDPAAYSP